MIDYDFLAAAYATKIAARLRQDKTAKSWRGDDAALFQKFAKTVDPTACAQRRPFRYLGWACRQYLNSFDGEAAKGFKAEDLYKIREDLALLEDKKLHKIISGAEADIGRYTFATLDVKAHELRGITFDGFEDKLRSAPELVMRNTSILRRGETGLALVPHTQEAAIFWSRGTRWCTGSTHCGNMFHAYNIEGPLVIMSPAGSKHWYQAHADSPVMNAHDTEAEITPELQALIDDIPAFLIKRRAEEIAETDLPVDWSSRDSALALVRRNCWALMDAPPEWRADPEIVLAAIEEDSGVFEYAADSLKNDRDFVLEAVRRDGGAIEFAAPALRADREIILEAVRKDGGALFYAPESLRDDRAFVLQAVRQNREAFEYISDRLRHDGTFVRECALASIEFMAILPSHHAMKFTDEEKRVAFENSLSLHWEAAQYAGDCGISLSTVRQHDIFVRARLEDPRRLAGALQIFPALRDAWKAGDLRLDEAKAILEKAAAAPLNRTPERIPVMAQEFASGSFPLPQP